MTTANFVPVGVTSPRGAVARTKLVNLTDARQAGEIVGHLGRDLAYVERAAATVAFVNRTKPGTTGVKAMVTGLLAGLWTQHGCVSGGERLAGLSGNFHRRRIA